MKTFTNTTSGSISIVGAMTMTLTALCLLGATFAGGYIVGAVQHAHRPAVTHTLPLCTRWGFMQPTPRRPNTALKCRLSTKEEEIS